MKKKRIISLFLSGVLALGLIGCGGNKNDEKTIKIGVTEVPHKAIIEQVVDDLKEEGYNLEIKVFNDYVTPNTAVEEGDLDANFFQHIAYLNKTNESKGYHLKNVAEVHVEPMGVYSDKLKNLDDLKDGATIAIPNDPSNEARALRLLQAAGLIEVKDSDVATPADITKNPKKLQFEELDAAQLTRTLEEVDAAVINGNYALQAGLDVNKDGLYIEDKNDEKIKEMRNILVVKEGSEDEAKIKALIEALTSDKVKKYIEEEYKGTVIPVF